MIGRATNIVITAHRGPDGDAIGSATALCSWLRRCGKRATIVVPNYFPDFLHWMPLAKEILVYDGHEADVKPAVEAADLLIMCDHGELNRMWTLGELVATTTAPRIMIDHHLNPDTTAAQLIISRPELSSTCELLMQLMLADEGIEPMTHDEAVSLYTGMMTDTGAFTYASNNPDIYELISLLLTKGIDKDKIYRNVFFTYSIERLRLMGYMLYAKLEVMKKIHCSLMTFTEAERRRFNIKAGETEGLVNLPLQMRGMKLSIFLREDSERPVIRVSLRSVDDFPCNEMAARFFNGGGHKNAAGGEVVGTMDDARKQVQRALTKYMPMLKESPLSPSSTTSGPAIGGSSAD